MFLEGVDHVYRDVVFGIRHSLSAGRHFKHHLVPVPLPPRGLTSGSETLAITPPVVDGGRHCFPGQTLLSSLLQQLGCTIVET